MTEAQADTPPWDVSDNDKPMAATEVLQNMADYIGPTSTAIADYNPVAAGLAEAEASFRTLTTADRAAARPYVVRTGAMPRGGFAELARTAPEPARAEAQLRLLNGVYGSGEEPKPGSAIKLIQYAAP